MYGMKIKLLGPVNKPEIHAAWITMAESKKRDRTL